MKHLLYVAILGVGLFAMGPMAEAGNLKAAGKSPSIWNHSTFHNDMDKFRNKDGAALPLRYNGKLNADTRAMRVSDLQRKLNRQGAGLAVDGIWGPKTSYAVAEFQQVNDLPVTGQVDAVTFDIISNNL